MSILFEQTSIDADKIFGCIAGFDVSCDEFRELCKKHGVGRCRILFVLIDLKRKLKDKSVFVRKTNQTCFLSVNQKKNFDFTPFLRNINHNKSSIENKEELEAIIQLGNSKARVKKSRTVHLNKVFITMLNCVSNHLHQQLKIKVKKYK